MRFTTIDKRATAAFRPVALFAIMALMPALAGAQQLTQPFGNAAGGISQVSAVQVSQDHFVTAVINSTGNLEVIAWYANLGSNQLVRQGTYYAGAASAVAVSSPFALKAGISGVFTTAAINAEGNLDLSYWQLQSNGSVTLVSEVQGDHAGEVSVASVYSQNGYQQFVTATRNSYGDLEVSLWHVDPVNGIVNIGGADAGSIHGVSIAALEDLHNDVVTAVTNNSGDLELIQWYYGAFQGPIVRGATTYTSTPAAGVAVATGVSTVNDPPFLVDAFYTAAVNPSSDVINLSAWNQVFGQQVSDNVVASSQVALAGNNGTAFVVGTPPAGNGAYYVRIFDQIGSSGFEPVTGAYGSQATNYSLALVDTTSNSTAYFAVAFRNSSGNLQIQIWKYVN